MAIIDFSKSTFSQKKNQEHYQSVIDKLFGFRSGPTFIQNVRKLVSRQEVAADNERVKFPYSGPVFLPWCKVPLPSLLLRGSITVTMGSTTRITASFFTNTFFIQLTNLEI